jgi:hypothetical protein
MTVLSVTLRAFAGAAGVFAIYFGWPIVSGLWDEPALEGWVMNWSAVPGQFLSFVGTILILLPAIILYSIAKGFDRKSDPPL